MRDVEHVNEDAELYVLGALGDLESARVERHVRVCEECAARVGEASATILRLIESDANDRVAQKRACRVSRSSARVGRRPGCSGGHRCVSSLRRDDDDVVDRSPTRAGCGARRAGRDAGRTLLPRAVRRARGRCAGREGRVRAGRRLDLRHRRAGQGSARRCRHARRAPDDGCIAPRRRRGPFGFRRIARSPGNGRITRPRCRARVGAPRVPEPIRAVKDGANQASKSLA